MSQNERRRSGFFSSRCMLALSAAGALALGGCSADVARFDLPSSLSLNDSRGAPSGAGLRGSSGNLSDQNPGFDAPGGTYYPPRSSRDGSVAVAALPDASAPPERPGAIAPPPAPVASDRRRPAPAPAAVAAAKKGEAIEVQQGDTLYALSKRYKVSIAELMALNDLKGPALKPGQKLHLPAGRSAGATAARKPIQRESEAVAGNPVGVAQPKVAAEPAPAEWGGTYTVKSGDSLFAIAARYNTKPADLQRVNGITDPRKVRPGVVLKVPGAGDGAAPPAATIAAAPAPRGPTAPPSAAEPTRAPSAGVRPSIVNGDRVAEAAPAKGTVSDAPPAVGGEVTVRPEAETRAPAERTVTVSPSVVPTAAGEVAATGKLRWPVRGRVIASFGQRTDGVQNDGINIAVPLGSDVQAAEAGVVAYAGNELKGYGNLVLVRHDNGWVTAYAHNDQILVKRGDKVRRGQTIAKAGKSGTVEQPQVHFELRQGSKPVDPLPFLEKL